MPGRSATTPPLAPLLAVALLLVAGPGASATVLPAASELPQAVMLRAPFDHASGSRWAEDVGPPPTIQDGIGPGSALLVGVGGVQFICSASFLLRDVITATYYLSTAGHCLVRDADDPKSVTGSTDPAAVNNHIEICVAGCLNNALGLGTYVVLKPAGGYHPVAFAKSAGIGDDFGLIEIPAEHHDLLRPEMPQWGGPTGFDAGSTGDLIVHYGHGSYCCPGVGAVSTRTPVDQGRIAISDGNDGEAFNGIGHVTGGDSGSGAAIGVIDATGVARGEGALGVITHAIVYAGAPLFSGTLMPHGMELAAQTTGFNLELVLAGDPLNAAPATTADVEILTPADGSRFGADDIVDIEGQADLAGLEDARVEVSVNDPTFGADNQLDVDGGDAWRATWDVGRYSWGTHTLYARLVRGSTVLAATNVTVTVDAHDDPAPAPPPSSSSAPKPKPAPQPIAPAGPQQAPAGDDQPTVAPPAGKTVPVAGIVPLAVGLVAVGAALRRRR